jgi:uncharacterized Zn finger protein (UPF0148 family)
MIVTICPKCKEPVVAPDNRDYVICSCGEVIYVTNEAHNRENEARVSVSKRRKKRN